MKDVTPAREIKEKDLALNCAAFSEVLKGIPKGAGVKTILDIRYGLGGWAKVAKDYLGAGVSIVGFEGDVETFAAAYKGEGIAVWNAYWVPEEETKYRFDLLLADFNVVTAKSRKLLDEAVGAVSPRYLIFTDVACVKLHLNYKAYGLGEADLEAYWNSFPLPDYVLRRFARKHHAASTALYERKPRRVSGV